MKAIGYTTTILAVLLGLSVLANVWLARAYLAQRDAAKLATERHRQALDDAAACSAGVANLRKAIDKQAEVQAAEIERARRAGLAAGRRAAAERNRAQAVPGDACASAEVETREWLQRRRAAE